MPRTWGYIIIVTAIAIGAGALLLPVPETVEVEPIVAPTEGLPRPALPTPARGRPRTAEPPPAPVVERPKPTVRPIPMQDTTKTRQLITPKPAG